ncbi:MAG: hypothetical protein KatS3mg008_0717 [Acidimicrobiales bacterium]|nr:MAG: hypothetical protein KatS3mg008_0717 [Acidimicrobiales bacterium]
MTQSTTSVSVSARRERPVGAAGQRPSPEPSPDAADSRSAARDLAERLGFDPLVDESVVDWLAVALRHRSWCSENPGSESNERLEFLGDAVLSMVVTERLLQVFPAKPEGDLAKARASVVDARTLAGVGERIGLGDLVIMSRAEEASGGRRKQSILADTVEAVIGAVYLGAGLDRTRLLVLSWLADAIYEAGERPGRHDYKTRLQELVARLSAGDRPVYQVESYGPDHARTFAATVSVGGKVLGTGSGSSKKEAQQAAAREALVELERQERSPHGEDAGGKRETGDA